MPIPKKKIARKETISDNNQLNTNDILNDFENETSALNKSEEILHEELKETELVIPDLDAIDEDDILEELDLDDIDEDEMFADLDDIIEIDRNLLKKSNNDCNRTILNSTPKETPVEESIPEKRILEEDPEERRRKLCTPCNFWGYEITSLLSGEEYLLKKLNLSEEMMSNYCLAKNVFFDYIDGYGDFKKEWGFPYSGRYIGYIMNCSASQKRAGDYIVEFLANNYDVCLFKFSTSFRDVVYNGIKRDLKLTDNIFRRVDFTAIKGFLVIISVENIRLDNGKVFSNITDFKIIDEDIIKMLDNLASDMMR